MKVSKILLTVATTNSLPQCEIGRAFCENNLDKNLVNPISFPGICLILKLNGRSRCTQRFSLLCNVLLLWFAFNAIKSVL